MAPCAIITVVVQVALLAVHLYYVAVFKEIAWVATQLTTWGAEQLATVSVNDWRSLRSQLEQHPINRVEQLRFRRSPADYLANKRISATLVNFATVEKNKNNIIVVSKNVTL